MALQVKITKKLANFTLDVDFSVEQEIFALLGASGCGKSMTLKCIAGIEQPDEGVIVLNGRTIFDSARKINLPPQKRQIGYMFQDYALFPNMTVLQNVMAGMGRRPSREQAQEYLRQFHIEELEQQYPARLSGGQKQRAAMARMLAARPEVILLLWYDWRLALLCMLFPPISFIVAEKMKVQVQKGGAAYKEQSGILSAATLDRASNAITYRVFGCEEERRDAYEQNLNDYEKSAVRANIWNSVMPPIYRIISMAGVFFILYFGGKNVLGIGWTKWDVAAFATFLACFTKLSVKSSSAAKLFNVVHKAQVSWKRIRPLMKLVEEEEPCKVQQAGELQVSHVDFAYPTGGRILENVSFTAKPGQIIGITGPVACGKSTLGKVFLCEYPYEGSIRFKNQELGGLDDRERIGIIGYLGHDPELFNDSIENNILMGEDEDIEKLLKMVCFDKEVAQMEEGIHTHVGSGGVRLSGGQAQRLALARTLCHKKPVLILDDPFSALDRRTEEQIFANLKNLTKDSIVLLISHRLYLFPQMDQVLWMENGRVTAGTHEELMSKEPEYAAIYRAQEGGEADEQK